MLKGRDKRMSIGDVKRKKRKIDRKVELQNEIEDRERMSYAVVMITIKLSTIYRENNM